MLHVALHLLVPAVAALVWGRARWWRVYAWMLAALLIDLDHLLADPVYDPQRCSIGFHPLHTWPAALVYVVLLLPARTRPLGLGLVIHLLLDSADCMGMAGGWQSLSGFLPG